MNGDGALAMGFRFLITALRTVLFISHPDGVINMGSIYLFSCRVPIGTHLFVSDNHRTTYGVIHISPRWGD